MDEGRARRARELRKVKDNRPLGIGEISQAQDRFVLVVTQEGHHSCVCPVEIDELASPKDRVTATDTEHGTCPDQ